MDNTQGRQVLKNKFKKELDDYVKLFNDTVSTNNGAWIIKGFIDIAKNIYTISVDTKVVSKIMELLLFPSISQFAEENNYKMVLSKEQNHYPDISFIDAKNNKFALDIKSTYRKTKNKINGMTLGAFTGYFRNRDTTKNTTFPYNDYAGHFVLGIVYSRTDENIDERKIYNINDLKNITSVINNFEFFVQEKYAIATDRPGSGNTKNIGSITDIGQLISSCCGKQQKRQKLNRPI